MEKVKDNSVVKVHYTGRLSDTDEVFDSSKSIEGNTDFEDREPLEVTLGIKQLIPGFEKALVGMHLGQKKSVVIPCEEAYGQPLDINLHTVEKKLLPEDVVIGDMLVNNTENGAITIVVKEINEDNVIVDANHPLCGKDLKFDLEVIEIN